MTKEYECPCHTTFAIYSANVDLIGTIKIGNGDKRVVINLPNSKSPSSQAMETKSNARNFTLTMREQEDQISHETSGGNGGAFRAGFGAALGGATYIALATNPLTAPLLMFTTGGAMIGAASMKDSNITDKSLNRSRTFTLECPAEEIEKLPDIIKQLKGTHINALE